MTGPDPDNPSYTRPMIENQVCLNKYPVTNAGAGYCTAYIYCYYANSDSYATPGLYSDVNGKPYWKKSKSALSVEVKVSADKAEGWRSSTFALDGSIEAGSSVWFGLYASWFTTRFDYAGECYKLWPDYENLYPDYEGDLPPYISLTGQ